MKANKYIIIIVFLCLALIGSLFLVLRTTAFFGKAATVNISSVALENSYLFASPLQAKADGKEQIRITVYLLDGRGIGVPSQKVHLKLPSTITVNEVQPESDESGKTIFDLSSGTKTSINISAITNNQELPQKAKITFY